MASPTDPIRRGRRSTSIASCAASRRADWERRTGQFDPEEISDRLQDLHERMHIAHERGHERMNNDWGYGYGYQPYGGYRRW